MAAPLLKVENVHCERDDRVLFNGFGFHLDAGEILQIEGPNGSGKTTLLRMLCGLTPMWEGEVFWQGENVNDCRSAFLENMLYVAHGHGVKAGLTANENLKFFASLNTVKTDITFEDALKRVGMAGYEDVICQQMSAGQRRRVGLARLILSASPLWVLDEPFTAIDKAGVEQLEQLFIDHVNEGGSVLITTHHALDLPEHSVRRLSL